MAIENDTTLERGPAGEVNRRAPIEESPTLPDKYYGISTQFPLDKPENHFVTWNFRAHGIMHQDLIAGPFTTREEARAVKARLEAAGPFRPHL